MNCTLEEILENREKRAVAQMQLLNKGYKTVVSFSLNIPGIEKKNKIFEKIFNEGILFLESIFGNKILERVLIESSAGDSFLFALNDESFQIKKETIEVEENHSLGRLFDIDVINCCGIPISRKQLGKAERKCLICDDIAKYCSRSQKHNIIEIKDKIYSIIYDWEKEKYSTFYSNIVEKALLAEVSTTPKPGLVDKNNSGSHKDMNYDTFINSVKVLKPKFKKFVELGFDNVSFEEIRKEGIKAEKVMLSATDGANTYKGIIFSLGFLCVAIGNELSNNIDISLEKVLERCSEYGKRSLDDFNNKNYLNTHGAECNINYGVGGIREEVASGFRSIIDIGLPSLKDALDNGYSLNDASIKTLIKLISCVKDTNMIHRGGIKKAIEKMNQAKMLEKNITKDSILEVANNLDAEYISENLSPGGCADLLAITLFFYYLNLN